MRQKPACAPRAGRREAVMCFEWAKKPNPSELKIVRAQREKYQRMSAVLDETPAVLDLARRDPPARPARAGAGRWCGFPRAPFCRTSSGSRGGR